MPSANRSPRAPNSSSSRRRRSLGLAAEQVENERPQPAVAGVAVVALVPVLRDLNARQGNRRGADGEGERRGGAGGTGCGERGGAGGLLARSRGRGRGASRAAAR